MVLKLLWLMLLLLLLLGMLLMVLESSQLPKTCSIVESCLYEGKVVRVDA